MLLLTPAVGGMARLLGVVDRAGGDGGVHRSPSRGSAGSRSSSGSSCRRSRSCRSAGETRGLLLGAAVATVVGAIDDFRGLRWWEKLGGQIAAAGIPVGFGIWVDRFTFPFVGVHDLLDVGRDAADRRLDRRDHEHGQLPRRDGRPGGRHLRDRRLDLRDHRALARAPEAAILAAIVAGACFGFLRHNFYPARIFMGDSGALLLGFLLAARLASRAS